MKEDREIMGMFSHLREIRPSDDYAARSRSVILATPRIEKRASWVGRVRYYLSESFGFALSVGLTSLIIALFISNAPQLLSPIIGDHMPGADTASMMTDASAAVKDIDVHLKEAQLFDTAASKTGTALKEAADGSAPHTNPLLIQKEADSVTTPPAAGSGTSAVDNALDQLTK